MSENQEVRKVYKSRPTVPTRWSESPEREYDHVSPDERPTVVIVEDDNILERPSIAEEAPELASSQKSPRPPSEGLYSDRTASSRNSTLSKTSAPPENMSMSAEWKNSPPPTGHRGRPVSMEHLAPDNEHQPLRTYSSTGQVDQEKKKKKGVLKKLKFWKKKSKEDVSGRSRSISPESASPPPHLTERSMANHAARPVPVRNVGAEGVNPKKVPSDAGSGGSSKHRHPSPAGTAETGSIGGSSARAQKRRAHKPAKAPSTGSGASGTRKAPSRPKTDITLDDDERSSIRTGASASPDHKTRGKAIKSKGHPPKSSELEEIHVDKPSEKTPLMASTDSQFRYRDEKSLRGWWARFNRPTPKRRRFSSIVGLAILGCFVVGALYSSTVNMYQTVPGVGSDFDENSTVPAGSARSGRGTDGSGNNTGSAGMGGKAGGPPQKEQSGGGSGGAGAGAGSKSGGSGSGPVPGGTGSKSVGSGTGPAAGGTGAGSGGGAGSTGPGAGSAGGSGAGAGGASSTNQGNVRDWNEKSNNNGKEPSAQTGKGQGAQSQREKYELDSQREGPETKENRNSGTEARRYKRGGRSWIKDGEADPYAGGNKNYQRSQTTKGDEWEQQQMQQKDNREKERTDQKFNGTENRSRTNLWPKGTNLKPLNKTLMVSEKESDKSTNDTTNEKGGNYKNGKSGQQYDEKNPNKKGDKNLQEKWEKEQLDAPIETKDKDSYRNRGAGHSENDDKKDKKQSRPEDEKDGSNYEKYAGEENGEFKNRTGGNYEGRSTGNEGENAGSKWKQEQYGKKRKEGQDQEKGNGTAALEGNKKLLEKEGDKKWNQGNRGSKYSEDEENSRNETGKGEYPIRKKTGEYEKKSANDTTGEKSEKSQRKGNDQKGEKKMQQEWEKEQLDSPLEREDKDNYGNDKYRYGNEKERYGGDGKYENDEKRFGEGEKYRNEGKGRGPGKDDGPDRNSGSYQDSKNEAKGKNEKWEDSEKGSGGFEKGSRGSGRSESGGSGSRQHPSDGSGFEGRPYWKISRNQTDGQEDDGQSQNRKGGGNETVKGENDQAHQKWKQNQYGKKKKKGKPRENGSGSGGSANVTGSGNNSLQAEWENVQKDDPLGKGGYEDEKSGKDPYQKWRSNKFGGSDYQLEDDLKSWNESKWRGGNDGKDGYRKWNKDEYYPETEGNDIFGKSKNETDQREGKRTMSKWKKDQYGKKKKGEFDQESGNDTDWRDNEKIKEKWSNDDWNEAENDGKEGNRTNRKGGRGRFEKWDGNGNDTDENEPSMNDTFSGNANRGRKPGGSRSGKSRNGTKPEKDQFDEFSDMYETNDTTSEKKNNFNKKSRKNETDENPFGYRNKTQEKEEKANIYAEWNNEIQMDDPLPQSKNGDPKKGTGKPGTSATRKGPLRPRPSDNKTAAVEYPTTTTSGLSEVQWASIEHIAPAAVFILAPIIGLLVQFAPRLFLLLGLFLLGAAYVGYGCIYFATADAVFFPIALTLRIVQGLGTASFLVALFAMLALECSGNMAMVTAMAVGALFAGFTTGPVIFYGFLQVSTSYDIGEWVLGGIAVIMSLICCPCVNVVNGRVEETWLGKAPSMFHSIFLWFLALVTIAAGMSTSFFSCRLFRTASEVTTNIIFISCVIAGFVLLLLITLFIFGAMMIVRASAAWTFLVFGLGLTAIGYFLAGPIPLFELQAYMWSTGVSAGLIAIGLGMTLSTLYSGMLDAANKAGRPDSLKLNAHVAGLFIGCLFLGVFLASIMTEYAVPALGWAWTTTVIAFLNIGLVLIASAYKGWKVFCRKKRNFDDDYAAGSVVPPLVSYGSISGGGSKKGSQKQLI